MVVMFCTVFAAVGVFAKLQPGNQYAVQKANKPVRTAGSPDNVK